MDAVQENRKLAAARSHVLENLGLKARGFVLATAHRQENVDSPQKLNGILKALDSVGRETGLPVIFPAHPRTQARLKEFGLRPEAASVVNPFGFMDFLTMEARPGWSSRTREGAGGACILGVPCVTMRRTPSGGTVSVGANVLAGTDPEHSCGLVVHAQPPRRMEEPSGTGGPRRESGPRGEGRGSLQGMRRPRSVRRRLNIIIGPL